jgi:hypothetical protein
MKRNLAQDVTGPGGAAFREIGSGLPSEPHEVTSYVNDEPIRVHRLDGSVVTPPPRPPRRCGVRTRRVLARRRGAGRPRAQATRSSIRSGDSGDPDDPDGEPAAVTPFGETAR